MPVGKITSKGQLTIPIEARRMLGLDKNSYVDVEIDGEVLHIRKLRKIKPLSDEDPIWQMIGAIDEGPGDVGRNHDRYLAEGEVRRWRSSSSIRPRSTSSSTARSKSTLKRKQA